MAKQTADIYAKIADSRRDDETRLKQIRIEQAEITRRLLETEEKREMIAKTTLGPDYKPRTTYEEVVTQKDKPEERKKLEQRAAELTQKAEEITSRQKEKSDKAADDRAKKREQLESEIADAQKANAEAGLSTDDLIKAKQEELNELQRKAVEDDIEDLEIQKKIEEVKGKIADLQRKSADEAKKEREEQERKAKALEDAKTSIAEANQARAESFQDRSSLSLGQVAGGEFQTSQTQKARAKEVMRLERQAMRQRATGFDESADISTSKALELRKKMGQLTGAERDPLAAANKAVIQSEQHLKNIEESLTRKPVATPSAK